jgi:hypothetical protein
MGLGIIRIFKAFKEITDKYEGTIKCSKRLDETLELIKNTWPEKQAKSLYRAGKLRVVKDVNWNTWHEVELQVQAQNPVTKQVVKVVETIIFRVQYYQGVVNQITLDLKAVDSKATYNEFEKALAELEDVKAAPAPVIKEEVLDFTDKTMQEVLTAFENATTAFGEKAGVETFAKVKAVRDALNKKIKTLEPKEKAAVMSSMSKIDTFVNAINMQFSNPAMASSVASFAGTYVSQILAEIAQMQTIC